MRLLGGYGWDLVRVLVQKELKLRYRGTYFGVLWSLANPIAFALVLHVAFRRVLQVDIDNYAIFILSTLFPWQWFTNSMAAGADAYVANSHLIKKLAFPRSSIPVAVVLGDATHFLMTIPILLILVLTSGIPIPLVTWLTVAPLLALIQTVHTVALVSLVACVNAILRDIRQLVSVMLLLLFYLTPILYPADMVPEDLRWLLWANPLAPIMLCWRDLVAGGIASPYIPGAIIHAALALAVTIPVYRRLSWRIPEIV